MSDLLSGQISFSGLGSGTDFGSIVTQLKQVESIPYMQMQGKRDTYDKQIDAVDEIIKVMEEARETLNKLSSRENFVKKELLFSNDSFITGKVTGEASDANYRIDVAAVAERSSAINNANTYTGKKDNVSDVGGVFEYSLHVGVDPDDPTASPYKTIQIQVTPEMTLEQLEHAVNNDRENPGVKMIVNESASGKVSIGFTSEDTGAGQQIIIGAIAEKDNPNRSNIFNIQFDETNTGADAKYTIDGFTSTSSSNEVKVADGLTIEFYDTGVSTISIKTDKDEVKKSIQEFLDAINSVIKEIDSHTNINVDAEEVKEEDSLSSINDPNEDMISKYLDDLVSGAPTVEGNILTGEYAVNSLDARITSILTAISPGFTRKATEDDSKGDLISTLTEMGIKINGVEGSANYGLFEIAPASSSDKSKIPQLDQERFDDYIENNLDEVIDFFVADEKMKTSATGFFVDSHIIGQTEPGVYDVSYDIDAAGKASNVMIGGETAVYDGESKTYTATAGGAAGIAIQISETGSGTYNETLKVQQGKIGEIAQMLDNELTPYSTVTYDTNGAINILKNGYKEAMESLDDQLWREEARLDTWENRKKLEFARLETLLSKYNGISESMSSQIAGMSG